MRRDDVDSGFPLFNQWNLLFASFVSIGFLHYMCYACLGLDCSPPTGFNRAFNCFLRGENSEQLLGGEVVVCDVCNGSGIVAVVLVLLY